jgi:hypothetical protein
LKTFNENEENHRGGILNGFTSMLDYYANNSSYTIKGRITSDTLPFEDEYLANFLTPEGVIEVGDYVFKINMPEEKVFVLHKDNIGSHLTDLYNENVIKDIVFEFSTNDEILTLLEEGYTGSPIENGKVEICRQSGAPSDKDYEQINYGGNVYRLNVKAVYQKAGIYFSLIGKGNALVKTIFGFYDNHAIGMWANYNASWTPKCKSTSTKSDNCTSGFSNGTGMLTHRFYESSRGLHKYSLKINFMNYFGGFRTRDLHIAH